MVYNEKTKCFYFSHNDSIQCLAYNPLSPILASCSNSDFGLWSPEQKNVQKFRIGARICCCSWNDDGTLLALGLASGIVTIRNKSGEEKVRIDRAGANPAPVWALCWSLNKYAHQFLFGLIEIFQKDLS